MIKSKNHASDKKLQAKTAMSILAQGAQFFLIAQNYYQGALELRLLVKSAPFFVKSAPFFSCPKIVKSAPFFSLMFKGYFVVKFP